MIMPKKRKNMKHLREMNDLAFCEWILSDPGSRLDLSWKLDGFFLRFGKDAEGKPWFQTARSDVLYDPKELVWHALSKGYDYQRISRSESYFHLINTIWDSSIMNSIPNDSGFECEVFNKEMSYIENGSRTFVNVPYDDSFFKTDITLAIYRLVVASTGQTWIDGYGGKIILDPKIDTFGTRFSIDIGSMDYFVDSVSNITDGGRLLHLFDSRKQADRAEKIRLKEMVARLKAQFGALVMDRAAKQNTMGPVFEGIVLSINRTEYKIVTPEFSTLISGDGR